MIDAFSPLMAKTVRLVGWLRELPEEGTKGAFSLGVFVELPRLPHMGHVLLIRQHAQVAQRAGIERDDVRHVALTQLASLGRLAAVSHAGWPIGSGSLDGLEVGHALQLMQVHHLHAHRGAAKWAVRARHDGHTLADGGGQGFMVRRQKGLPLLPRQLADATGALRGIEDLCHHIGGAIDHALLGHLARLVGVHGGAMLDGVNPAIDGVLNAAVAVCVCGHGALGAARLVHHGGDLTRRKLVIGGLIVLREDAAGGHYLDDVRLLAQIETHLSQAGWHAITQSADALPFLAHDHVHRQDVLIRVAARHANVAASVMKVRPLQLITGDELSNGLREGAAQLTHAGDAGIQRFLNLDKRVGKADVLLRVKSHHQLAPACPFPTVVRVAIPHAGHHDWHLHLRLLFLLRGRVSLGAGVDYGIALDEDDARLERLAATRDEQVGRDTRSQRTIAVAATSGRFVRARREHLRKLDEVGRMCLARYTGGRYQNGGQHRERERELVCGRHLAALRLAGRRRCWVCDGCGDTQQQPCGGSVPGPDVDCQRR
mmetsp:Transcript_7122/g.18257  ORF Transcript_7122/g.18257 Transcript_7122/m.18257 type:complete len:543 (-) Transcript_7122:181-1809(-)